jgi:hypothetical protein
MEGGKEGRMEGEGLVCVDEWPVCMQRVCEGSLSRMSASCLCLRARGHCLGTPVWVSECSRRLACW